MDNFETTLISKLNYLKDSKVKQAMIYSLSAGGKRIRPQLLYETVKGFNKDINDLDNLAVAIEMIHTYSLVHDDLPAMDDDTLRRGKNTCHIQFDEATAILAGDALLTEAFTIVSKSNIEPLKLIRCINILSEYSGANGMIYGQELDMNSQGKDFDFSMLKEIHKYKTGALLSIPLQLGCILCDQDDLISTFKEIGYKIGLAFQIQDDILDEKYTSEQLGKSNSDKKNMKITSITTLGLKQSTIMMNELYNDIKDSLKSIENFNSEYLLSLIDKLSIRRK